MGHDEDRIVSGLITDRDMCKVKEAVCIQVEKVYDSCKEKDCVEHATVYFGKSCKIQKLIDKAKNVKIRRAVVVDVFADVEPVPFKKGFYTVDIKYFILVTLDFFLIKPNGCVKIITKHGLVLFDKKVILFGSEGNVKIFKSHFVEHGLDKPEHSTLQQDNLPISKVEVAEPIGLNARIVAALEKHHSECCCDNLPRSVEELLDSNDEIEDFDDIEIEEDELRHHIEKKVVVTIGLFSIIKLVRFVQLLIPAFDFCVPHKRCIASTDEDPCELFETIDFPVDEFFPPQKFDFPGAMEEERGMRERIEE